MSVTRADLDSHSNLFYLNLFRQLNNYHILAVTACGSNGILTEYSKQMEGLSAATNASALHSAIEWHESSQTIPAISGARLLLRSFRRTHPEQQNHIMNSSLRQVLINSRQQVNMNDKPGFGLICLHPPIWYQTMMAGTSHSRKLNRKRLWSSFQ